MLLILIFICVLGYRSHLSEETDVGDFLILIEKPTWCAKSYLENPICILSVI